MKTPPPATEASDAELERFKAWLAINDPRPFTPGAYSYQAAKWKAWQAALSYPAAAVGGSMDELRRACAEILGCDPETWPDHGNAPLAIAASLALAHQSGATPAAPVGGFVVEQVNVADVAVSQGNWGQHDGSTIIGWRVSAETLREMGMSSMCLPKEIGEDLERLRTIATWWETGAKDRRAKLEAALKESLPEDRDTRVRLWNAILPLVYTIASPTAQPSAKDGGRGELPLQGDIRAQAYAWIGVTELLDELSPGWQERPGLGKDIALDAIRDLATTASGLGDGDRLREVLRRVQNVISGDGGIEHWVIDAEPEQTLGQFIEAAIGREVGDV